ncbi:MAG: GNAT family protein [Rhodanobacter sp.]
MQQETSRLRIDALRPGDAEALFACRSAPSVARFQGWCPVDLAAARDFIDAQRFMPAGTSGQWSQRAVRLRESGLLIGDMGLYLPKDARGPVEFGVSITPRHQGNGYASEAVRALFGEMFGTQGRHRIQASVDPRNLASMAMLRALGMRQEAHHIQSLWLGDEWVDDVIFAMLASEWPAHRAATSHRG